VAGRVPGDWADNSTDKWMNGCWTHGISLSEWEGATWHPFIGSFGWKNVWAL
jgi:hypothetical protein